VIDSDPAVLQAMEALLGKWNCEVIAAASGEEMKEKLAAAARVPSLIISDYRPRAPATVGAGPTLAIIDMLRSEFNTEIPAVLLTGDTAAERAARPAEVAGLPVLHKPLNPARLRTLIANLLRMDEAHERSRRAS
jgi:CheY-like chemotaxis protein